VLKVKGGDFRGSGPGIIEQMQQGVIPVALLVSDVHGLQHRKDFFRVQEADQGLLGAFLRDA